MRRGRIRIRNKMGFQIVTILIFTIILPSIFFFWFIVQRYSNDLLSAAISERENLLEAINKSISLHFDNVQELSMTIYYDTSTKNYIDGHAYEEPSAAVEEALVTILNSRQSAESMALCFGGETYVYGKSFTNLQRYREQYEQQVLEREGKCVWLPTNVIRTLIGYDTTDLFRLDEIRTAAALEVPAEDAFSGLYVLDGSGTLTTNGKSCHLEKTAQFFVPAAAGAMQLCADADAPLRVLHFFGPKTQ